MRWVNGYPEKIGGWEQANFYRDETVNGVVRSIYSMEILGRPHLLIGTNTRLYDVNGGQLVNITPIQPDSVAAANSLSTSYDTLANNPFTMTNGSNLVVINDVDAPLYKIGDTITISGVGGAVRGIPAAQLNASHVIRSMTPTSYSIRVATSATSSGTGGGASVIRSSGLLVLNSTAHGLNEGDRVEISGAADTGGILAAEINNQFVIRNVSANEFSFMTAGTATSAVTASGGASTEYFPQLEAGSIDEVALQGYGAGLYGVGLYGTALPSNSGKVYPRIWFMDRYGDSLIATPGDGSMVYSWNGAVAEAPVPVANAPEDVNYAFVSDNILVTFGANGVENRIAASDQNNITNWTSSSLNQVFRDDIEGAGRLLTHVPIKGSNLIFTDSQTYTFRKISLEAGVWEIKLIDPNVGIIAPMARVSVRGIAYWMGENNFYMYRGGNVEIIPSNDPAVAQSTCLRYVFDNINNSQKYKTFAWYNPDFDEMWIHYPSASSNECDRIVRVNLTTFVWTIDVMDRTAAEYPSIGASYPRLSNLAGSIFYHEIGNDENGSPMSWELRTSVFTLGKKTGVLQSFVPDSNQTGSINVTVRSKLWPRSTAYTFNKTYTVSESTQEIQCKIDGRYWEYLLSGSEIDQTFKMGVWQEEVQEGSDK